MYRLHPYSIFHLGDSALTIDFGNLIDDELNKKVLQLFQYLKACGHAFIVDLVPAYSSLTVYYDVVALKKINPAQTAFDTISDLIHGQDFFMGTPVTKRTIEIPVCYSTRYALDIDVFKEQGIGPEELVALHTARNYRVYMIGFLPGFAYMAEVDEKLVVPRKESPRIHVDPGSVGIAGKQTGIYPLSSPGGWQIIGRTPLRLFDREKDNPVLLQPGDEVKFYSIGEDEFENYQSRHS